MICGGNGNIYSELQIWLDLESGYFSQMKEGDPQKAIQGLSVSVIQKMNTIKNKQQNLYFAEGSLILYINNPVLDKINIASYVGKLAEIKAGVLIRQEVKFTRQG